MNPLYERIVCACKMRGITPSGLCDKIGLRRASISELKNGTTNRLGVEKIEMLAKALNVSCDYLITGSDFHSSYSLEEQQLIQAWRLCSDSERENVAFILRDYGMPAPASKKNIENAG